MSPPPTLPDGYELRESRPADLDELSALLTARGDAFDAQDLRLVVRDAGHDACAVVTHEGRVVSTATLLDETVTVRGPRGAAVTLPAGQVELVATDRAHEGRGLVRALMGWAHDRSRRRGHLVQVMLGISYFYRQFGYEYAMPQPRWLAVRERPDPPADVTVREATPADVPAMDALQRHPTADVVMPHSARCWQWLLERDGSRQLVAERGGEIVGAGRVLPPHEDPHLGELAVADEAAAVALVAHEWRSGLQVQQRLGTVGADAIAPLVAPADHERWWYYARVPDFAELLRALAPVLSARLLDAGLTDERELVISSFRSHVRLALGPDGVRGVTAGGAMQSVAAVKGSAVPPDAVAQLLLGPHGAVGLAERLPDCYLQTNRDVMAALFPPVHADVLCYYLAG